MTGDAAGVAARESRSARARIRTVFSATAVVIATVLLIAAPAFAGEEAPSPADSTVGWIFRWVNFAIVAGLIVYLLRSVGAPQLKERAKEIGVEIQQAADARTAAVRERDEATRRLAGIEGEISRLREIGRNDEAAAEAQLQILIRADIERIKHAATVEIEAAERTARLELKTAAAKMAVARAEGMLRQQMTRQKQTGLMATFVKQLFGWAR